MSRIKSEWILTIIVITQFCCTSLWFGSNAVVSELAKALGASDGLTAQLTSFVQFGFISGTLVFAFYGISDRYSPSKVFFWSAICGALFNLLVIFSGHTWLTLSFRFLTGFFLAGVYPVGMKIAADYFEKGLGKSLGFLVGALVLGTAFPHLAKGALAGFQWQYVLVLLSGLAMAGGTVMFLLVPDGPYRKKGQKIDLAALKGIWKNVNLRKAAFGYFGHMWELYTFWTFVPLIWVSYGRAHATHINTSLYSFVVIGIGAIACIIGGFLSERFGPKRIAKLAIGISGCCCLLFPMAFSLPILPFFAFLLIWGTSVIMDSPLFSTLVAQSSYAETRGTAITMVNCIGFSLTILSIQLTNLLISSIGLPYALGLLAVGPIIGLWTNRS